MKALIGALVLMVVSQASFADELLCASKKNQDLYYTSGQVLVRAEINSQDSLSFVSMDYSGSSTLGLTASEDEILGQAKGKYTRFDIGSDALCNYRLALPAGFMTKSSTVAFLDANCEENSKYSITLYCSVQ